MHDNAQHVPLCRSNLRRQRRAAVEDEGKGEKGLRRNLVLCYVNCTRFEHIFQLRTSKASSLLSLLFLRRIIGTLSLPSHFLTSGTPSAREEVLNLLKEFMALKLPDLHPSVARNPEFDVRRSLEPLEPLQISLHDEWSKF